MIVPLVTDNAWRETLQGIPLWSPPAISTIIVAPHPDDETLGAGGLVKSLTDSGVDVTVVAVTDGEGAYADELGLARIRRSEQEAALEHLGVSKNKVVRLGIPDRYVSDHQDSLSRQLRPLITSANHVVAPWTGDFHPDHEACGYAAQQVALAAGASLSFYFFWTWHRGTPDTLRGLPLHALPLGASTLRSKRKAILEHQSQLVHHSGEPILPEDLLTPTLWPFEVFAAA